MNKLYIIRFLFPDGDCISTWSAWNEEAALENIRKNPEWKFSVVEDNETHKIWEAR